jgi:hypothetical protein
MRRKIAAQSLASQGSGITVLRVLRWHVRFAGRAVFLTVRFGSAPTRANAKPRQREANGRLPKAAVVREPSLCLKAVA